MIKHYLKISTACIFFMFYNLPAQNLQSRMDGIASAADGKAGAGLMLAETGESAWLNPDEQFPMQSVYKLPIAMAILNKVDAGQLNLGDTILVRKEELISTRQHSPIRDMHPEGNFSMLLEDLIRYAVSESDGTASDVLMRLCGGPSAVQKYLALLGIAEMRVLNTEMEIGKYDSVQYANYASPREAVKLLSLLQQGNLFKMGTQQMLMKYMTDSPTGLKRLKGRLPAGAKTAHKTGSSRTVKGITAATNDIGIITLPDGRHLIAAVFIADSKAPDSVREEIIAKIARLGWDYWTRK